MINKNSKVYLSGTDGWNESVNKMSEARKFIKKEFGKKTLYSNIKEETYFTIEECDYFILVDDLTSLLVRSENMKAEDLFKNIIEFKALKDYINHEHEEAKKI